MLHYSEKKKNTKREEEIMAVVLSMVAAAVVVVREVDVSMKHRNVILIRLIQTLD